ncbi:hypothetical protein EUX98_g6443 [Antrodiella citrinella]|uniref:Deacetylase sirtuin-type domain-containing protein n=1 Tax=Antrodiella citrinella TaxID=2447956 RepID=A0A4S4MRL1_9APHY|nr:hypothetical protein EUX98_g6443 [Antrodiella citrinella]
MESQKATSSSENTQAIPTTASAHPHSHKCVHAVFIRTFLEAAECVETDAEVIDDLLEDHDTALSFADEDEDVDMESLEDNQVSEVMTPGIDSPDSEFDPLEPFLAEYTNTWTVEEVKRIVTDLKEHGKAHFIKEYVVTRAIPIPKLLYAFDVILCTALRAKPRKTLMFFLEVGITRTLDRRDKLPMYNTVDDAVKLIQKAKRIIILTGAGISVSCGIPDFRSRTGLYATLQDSGEYFLDDPQQMSVLSVFVNAVYLRPPVKRVKAKKKGKKKSASPWDEDSEEEPIIPVYPPGIIKASFVLDIFQRLVHRLIREPSSHQPDITFFGEKLSDEFDKALLDDRPLVDLLLVIGTSLKVSPVSDILTHLRHSIPQILINKTPIKHANPDVVLLGNADDVVQYLCRKLGWDLPDLPSKNGASHLDAVHPRPRKRLSEEIDIREPKRVGNSHVWLFEGAEGGKWVEDIAKKHQEETSSSSKDVKDEDEEVPHGETPKNSKKARTG